jgi:DNA invertase Pin-like site-specific DNA recombinase
MRAVGYLRGLPERSLESQYRAYLDYCERHGLEVGPAYTEAEIDAGHRAPADAPQLRRLLRQAREQQRAFTVVVAAALEVLGASASDQARRYLQLEALGLPLRLADERDPDHALIEAWQDRGDDERRRERVREAMRRRALRGEALGRPPYGYRVVDHRLEPEPAEAEVVREIFRLALEDNLGVRRIARALNERGRRTRRSQPWSMVSVRSILRNAVYTGKYRRLDVVVPRAHEALVSRAHFDAVQARLDERRTSGGEQHRHAYLLSGLARCGACGNRMIGVTRGDEDRERVAYQCESRQNQSRCDYHTRRAEEIEAAVRAELVAAAAASSLLPAGATPERDLEGLRARRRSLRRDLERQIERRAAGQWTAEQLRRRSAEVVLADLEAEMHESASDRRSREDGDEAMRRAGLAEARQRLAYDWDALSFEVRRALLHEVVAEVIVTDDAFRVELAR